METEVTHKLLLDFGFKVDDSNRFNDMGYWKYTKLTGEIRMIFNRFSSNGSEMWRFEATSSDCLYEVVRVKIGMFDIDEIRRMISAGGIDDGCFGTNKKQ